MAKRNKKGQFVKGGHGGKARRRHTGGAKIVRVSSAPTTIRVAAPKTRSVRRHHRRSVGGSISNFFGGRSSHRTALVLGSAALGYASKQGWLAKLPVVGKAGPITSFGLLGWGAQEFLKIKMPSIVDDMVTAALGISAFNIGFSGGTTLVGDGYQMPGGAVFFD